jgi:flagellar basal-body rod protein FlgB
MKLFTEAVRDLESSLRFRESRQVVLAANIANADTPGYRPADLEFEALLGDEQIRLARTHEGHLPVSGDRDAAYRLRFGPRGEGPLRNGVNLEQELVRMSRNAGAYQDHADVLSRMLGLVRSAIAGEG